jgi:hypothetical protein
MPSHCHQYNKRSGAGGEVGFGETCSIGWFDTTWTGGSQSHTHSLSLYSTGSSNNLPPYYALAFIIQIK